jgi:hypothetical protein
MMTAEDTRYAATLAWIEQLVAGDPHLNGTRHEYFTLAGQLWVRVEGAQFETLAWHHAVGGLIRPSSIDKHGVRRQMIFGTRIHVEVIDDPHTRPEPKGGDPDDALLGLVTREPLAGGKGPVTDGGSIRIALTFIITLAGLFLWGWTHSSRSPNGATLLAVAVLGVLILVPAVFIRWWRELDRRSARYTKAMQPRVQQDTSGDHIWDA